MGPELDDFLRFSQVGRRLAAETCRAYERDVSACIDPVPLFELVLSPSTARRAMPVLGAVTAAGFALLVRRAPC